MQNEQRPAEGGGLNFQGTVATVFAAYVGNNAVAKEQIGVVIQEIAQGLRAIDAAPVDTNAATLQEPAVSIKKSVGADYIICLEDGKKFKSLKRHLRTRYNMTPDQYRAKWGLSHDYPMVAPNYAKERSALAKRMGLGNTRKATT